MITIIGFKSSCLKEKKILGTTILTKKFSGKSVFLSLRTGMFFSSVYASELQVSPVDVVAMHCDCEGIDGG